jgi:hypothetical protein
MTSEHAALTAYLRGNFFPPLPHAYVEWVESLLPDMQAAVFDAEYNDLRAIDAMVPIPAAVLASGYMPKMARDGEGGPEIRLGDLISALRLYDHFTSDEDEEE